MANVLFINEDALRQASLLNENVDMKLITPTIRLAQEKYVLPLLGTGIYNELKTQIAANTLTTLNKTLLDDYVQPCLVWWIMSEIPVNLTYRLSNKAVMKNSSDNGQPAEMSELLALMDRAKDNAQWYSERVTLYLVQNAANYPLFDNPGNGIDTILPNRKNFSKGMYLGEPRETFGLPVFSDREHYMNRR
jgi:hypothetical protein